MVSYYDFHDDYSKISEDKIPKTGTELNTVVHNFVDETLYLSAKPEDRTKKCIKEWQELYDFIEDLKIGDIATGVVEKSAPFGLFIDFG